MIARWRTIFRLIMGLLFPRTLPSIPPRNPMHQALDEVVDQLQVLKYRYETGPPLNRTEILARAKEKIAELDVFIGRKDGTQIFRAALISLAAFLLFCAAAITDNQIGVE